VRARKCVNKENVSDRWGGINPSPFRQKEQKEEEEEGGGGRNSITSKNVHSGEKRVLGGRAGGSKSSSASQK
jgi:hypothetical protein